MRSEIYTYSFRRTSPFEVVSTPVIGSGVNVLSQLINITTKGFMLYQVYSTVFGFSAGGAYKPIGQTLTIQPLPTNVALFDVPPGTTPTNLSEELMEINSPDANIDLYSPAGIRMFSNADSVSFNLSANGVAIGDHIKASLILQMSQV